jgi:Protein of unknown function (DUF3567)
MQMLYNSDQYVVVQFELTGSDDTAQGQPAVAPRGGYEIVDKFARKEIFIEGAMAASFREGVEALIETSPSEDEVDDYIARFAALMQQPVILH